MDDLLINIQIGLLDDIADGDTLANARPIAFRTDSAGLPYVAEVGVADEVNNANLDDVLSMNLHIAWVSQHQTLGQI